jgi:hypothetical protein
MHTVHHFVLDSLARAQQAMATTADRSATPVQFRVGDSVLLHAAAHDGLPLFDIAGTAKKLQPRWLGPFLIHKVGRGHRTYTLDLPSHYKINSTVDAKQLRLFVSRDDTLFPQANLLAPSTSLRNGLVEHDVQDIISHRYFGKSRALQFLVQWAGFAKSASTWEPASGLKHSRALVQAYKRKHRL